MVRAGAMVGAGLLLALAATLAPLPPATGPAGASLAVRLPSVVQTAVLTLLALSALLLILLQRPRRPTEDEPAAARVPRRPPAWAAVFALLPFVTLLGLAWYIAAHRAPGDDAHPIERAFTAIAGLMDLLARARKTPTSIPLFDATIAALVLAAAAAVFALLLLVTLAPRLEKWLARRDGTAAVAARDDAVVALGDPHGEPDPRRAILLAWGRFEHALAAAGAPRAPWQTPAELMRATLARLAVPAAPLRRLTALVELARFSDRPLDAASRAAACESLDALTTALGGTTARAR